MNKSLRRISPILLGGMLALGLHLTPANAQASRTFVSGVGSDGNPCSRTAPCKTFAGAIGKTAVGGEINVLDPGGFGAVTIVNAITIRAVGVEAGVLVGGTNGITVAAGASDTVNLIGLDFIATTTPLAGVQVTSAGNVNIANCSFTNFAEGVNVVPSSPTSVLITNSRFMNNATGVLIQSANTSATAFGLLDHVTIIGKTKGSAVSVVGAAASAVVTDSTITNHHSGLSPSAGGKIYSYGNNRVTNNVSNGASNEPLLTTE
jgi:hypothetical protein